MVFTKCYEKPIGYEFDILKVDEDQKATLNVAESLSSSSPSSSGEGDDTLDDDVASDVFDDDVTESSMEKDYTDEEEDISESSSGGVISNVLDDVKESSMDSEEDISKSLSSLIESPSRESDDVPWEVEIFVLDFCSTRSLYYFCSLKGFIVLIRFAGFFGFSDFQ